MVGCLCLLAFIFFAINAIAKQEQRKLKKVENLTKEINNS
jgi:hypothetical protein